MARGTVYSSIGGPMGGGGPFLVGTTYSMTHLPLTVLVLGMRKKKHLSVSCYVGM